jgi:hypothetical protein
VAVWEWLTGPPAGLEHRGWPNRVKIAAAAPECKTKYTLAPAGISLDKKKTYFYFIAVVGAVPMALALFSIGTDEAHAAF